MAAYFIFDVEIRDMSRYQDFMAGVKPALEAAGAKYLFEAALLKSSKAIGSRAESCFWNFPLPELRKSSTMGRSIGD
jgi:uncharacterized protein (DUF1330 family)